MRSNEFEKIAKLLAKQYKIIIREGRGWAANIKDRKVFYKKKDIYTLPEDHILGLLLHEIAHIHYTTEVTQPPKNKEITHATLNMIEDISIENIISGDYPNAGEILSSTKQEVLDTLVRILPKIKQSEHEKALLYAAARFENRGDPNPKEKYEKLGNKISKIMIQEKKLILGRKETKDLMPLVSKIVKMLLDKFGEPTVEEKISMMEDAAAQTDGISSKSGGKAKTEIIGQLGGTGYGKDKYKGCSNIKFIDKIADKAIIIGKQLRSVLKRNNAMEFGGRYRTGKLITRRLIRIKIVKDRRPFGRRIIKSNKSYAFAIASDISGSMYNHHINSNIDYAMSSLYMVGEALRIAQIPRSLIVFGENAQKLNNINKNRMDWSDISNDTHISKAGQHGTDIAAAINLCKNELINAKAERKIMIILTDGISNPSTIKEAHSKATKIGIECIAITIGKEGSRSIEGTFKESHIKKILDTKNTDIIGKAFIDVLKENIKSSP